MAVTEAQVLAEVKRLVYSTMPFLRPWEDQLADVGGISDSDTSMDVADGTQWSQGDIVAFADGTYDLARVTSVSTNTLTIQRNVRGATAASHSQNAEIEKNPRFTDQEIKDAVDRVIRDLWPRIYTIQEQEFTYAATDYWYTWSDTQAEEAITVYHEDQTYANPMAMPAWSFRKGLNAAEFDEAQGLYLPHGYDLNPGDKFWVVYKQRIDAASDLADRQRGIVALGAAYHIVGAEDAARTYDPGRQVDRTVQPGQNSRDSIWFLREFRQELINEETRLKKDEDGYPQNRHAARRRRFRV